jgi:hypothetical protein
LALALPLLAACLDFDAALNARIAFLDGGADAGSPDSGMPGCPTGQWCLVSTTVIGWHVRSVQPDGHGHFTAITLQGLNSNAQTYFLYADGGAYSATPTPNFFTVEGPMASLGDPYQMALRNGWVGIADNGGMAALLELSSGSSIATTTCGDSANAYFTGVTWLDDETIALSEQPVGTEVPRVCRLSRDGGMRFTDYGPAQNFGGLTAIAALPSGDLFFGDGVGQLFALGAGQTTAQTWLNPDINDESVGAIAGTDLNNLWAVWAGGNSIATYLGDGGWVRRAAPPGSSTSQYTYSAPWVVAPNEIWIGDHLGHVFHFNGTAWETITLDGLDMNSNISSLALIGDHDLAIGLSESLGGLDEEGRLLVYHRP